MRSTGILMLIVAIVVGGITAWLVMNFLQNQAQPVAQPQASTTIAQTTVVVAATKLSFGDNLTRDNLKEVSWPTNNVPPGSFKTINEILDGADRRVALQNMEPNEMVLHSRVSGFGGRATLSQVISDGMRATTIRVNDVNGVAGFVLPGDRVDIMLTRNTKTGSAARDSMVTDVIIQNLRVLGVDQISNEDTSEPVVPKAVTLEVSPEDAQKLSLAASIGTLTLSLRNYVSAGTEEATRYKTISVNDLRPVGARSTSSSAPTPAPTYTSPTVRVTRGTTSSSQKVARE
ncbi:MAG: Flp pilus assembly protein CpaB [Alphaproteobacteria bacterium]|nr:MAG: Flp pilus assembly protein CpaB [Alphaproteobacteria bacterium]